jgi:hypothetical protein
LAWHYKQYNKDIELATLELEAQKKKLVCGRIQIGLRHGILEENEKLLKLLVLTNYNFTVGNIFFKPIVKTIRPF